MFRFLAESCPLTPALSPGGGEGAFDATRGSPSPPTGVRGRFMDNDKKLP
jgi:hypothetical protein